MAIFPIFFVDNIGKENVFYDIIERKNAFLGSKNKKFIKSKNWHFSKEVNPWFWSKNVNFSSFFLGIIGHENVFYNLLEQKNAYLVFKKNTFKKSKNWDFSKGANPWFWLKICHLPIVFFFGQYIFDWLQWSKTKNMG